MFNHLIHFTKSLGLQQRTLSLRDFPGARALTPPHSTSARGNDNLHYHYHDIVAISMSTGGWVFEPNQWSTTLWLECLSQNVMFVECYCKCHVYAFPLCVVFVASVWCHTFRIPISTSTEHGSPPQDKWSVKTLGLPNLINKYIYIYIIHRLPIQLPIVLGVIFHFAVK